MSGGNEGNRMENVDTRYLEKNFSFSLLIQTLKKRKNRNRYVYLKPFITISSADKQVLLDIREEFGIGNYNKIRKNETKNSTVYLMPVQNHTDIATIINIGENHKFLDKRRETAFYLFKGAYEVVVNYGHQFKSWSEGIEKYLKFKDAIGKVHLKNSKTITAGDWKKKIKEFFEEGDGQ